jgi:hypothetical protein
MIETRLANVVVTLLWGVLFFCLRTAYSAVATETGALHD